MLASFLLDSFGLLGVPETGFQVLALVGVLTALIGASLILRGGGESLGRINPLQIGLIALALIAGGVLPVQGAVNALLRNDLGDAPLAAAAVSFAVATLCMASVLGAAVMSGKGHTVQLSGVTVMPWWGWVGGVAGATYVTTVLSAIPIIGASATIGFTVVGQQMAGLLVDRYGWLRLPRRPPSRLRIAGVVLLLIGVLLIRSPFAGSR
jgi:transporter family-2 protein